MTESCTQYDHIAVNPSGLFPNRYRRNGPPTVRDNGGVGGSAIAGTVFTVTQQLNMYVGPRIKCHLRLHDGSVLRRSLWRRQDPHQRKRKLFATDFNQNWTAGQWVNDSMRTQCVAQQNSMNYCPDVKTGNPCDFGGSVGTLEASPIRLTRLITGESRATRPSIKVVRRAISRTASIFRVHRIHGWHHGSRFDYGNLKALMRQNQNNAYQYGDAKSVTNLMHMAFGPMLDGQHTLDNSISLNAVQVLDLFISSSPAAAVITTAHILIIFIRAPTRLTSVKRRWRSATARAPRGLLLQLRY